MEFNESFVQCSSLWVFLIIILLAAALFIFSLMLSRKEK